MCDVFLVFSFLFDEFLVFPLLCDVFLVFIFFVLCCSAGTPI